MIEAQKVFTYIATYMITISVVFLINIILHEYSKKFEFEIQRKIVGTYIPLTLTIGIIMLVTIMLKMFVL